MNFFFGYVLEDSKKMKKKILGLKLKYLKEIICIFYAMKTMILNCVNIWKIYIHPPLILAIAKLLQ